MDIGELTLKSKEADKIGRHRFCVAPMMDGGDLRVVSVACMLLGAASGAGAVQNGLLSISGVGAKARLVGPTVRSAFLKIGPTGIADSSSLFGPRGSAKAMASQRSTQAQALGCRDAGE
jgi:hypothetical protein